jgi:RNA polymerase sigma-70 factor (ECF subfamily)
MTDIETQQSVDDQMSDEEILRLCVTDPDSFSHLVKRYELAFLRKAKRILFSPEDAEDAVQDAFVRMYVSAARFSDVEGGSFRSWAYTILVNTCLTQYSKKKRRNEQEIALDPKIASLFGEKDPAVEQLTMSEYVFSILSRMPEGFARVLEAYYLEGRSQKELACEEGVSISAIKTRVHRAKNEFRKISAALSPRP